MKTLLEKRTVEGVEIGGCQLGQFDRTQRWHDTNIDDRAVADHGRWSPVLGLQVKHPLFEEIGHRPSGSQVHAVLDLSGQLVSGSLGEPLAPLDSLVDVAIAASSRVAASRHPDLPLVGPLLANASGHEICLTRLWQLWPRLWPAAILTQSTGTNNCL
jgi:hypothetical protein